LTLSSDFQHTLRRLKPHKFTRKLDPRKAADLQFLGGSGAQARTFLYDTTVYIDILQDRFPKTHESALRSSDAWHSSVAEAELAAACALLDPAHSSTQVVIKQILEVANRIPRHRLISPDEEIFRDAGILTGTLARLQKISKSDRRRIFNDALIFASARKYGHTVLTRNIIDFDFLQQLDPTGRVMFYRN
jgi:predicted nucleic acid-binding protein